MIDVNVTEHGIRMQGHAGCSADGQDLVCSAISALTCSLVHSLQSLTDNRIRADTASGSAVVEWEELSGQGKLLVDSWFLGLAAVNREYNCIRFV